MVWRGLAVTCLGRTKPSSWLRSATAAGQSARDLSGQSWHSVPRPAAGRSGDCVTLCDVSSPAATDATNDCPLLAVRLFTYLSYIPKGKSRGNREAGATETSISL